MRALSRIVVAGVLVSTVAVVPAAAQDPPTQRVSGSIVVRDSYCDAPSFGARLYELTLVASDDASSDDGVASVAGVEGLFPYCWGLPGASTIRFHTTSIDVESQRAMLTGQELALGDEWTLFIQKSDPLFSVPIYEVFRVFSFPGGGRHFQYLGSGTGALVWS